MSTFQNIHLNVKPGDVVRIIIPEENLKYDCGEVFPQRGTGIVTEFEERDGNRHHLSSSDGGTCAFVNYDEPFFRRGLLETLLEKGEGGAVFNKKGKIKGFWRKAEWVPRVFLQHEK